MKSWPFLFFYNLPRWCFCDADFYNLPASTEDGKFLLSARKCRRATHTDYIISLNCEDVSRGSDTYIGKLRYFSWYLTWLVNHYEHVWIKVGWVEKYFYSQSNKSFFLTSCIKTCNHIGIHQSISVILNQTWTVLLA